MKQLLPLFIAAVLISSCANSPDGSASGNMDWHLFRGDASLSGYTSNRLPENPELLWSYKSMASAVSSPVVNNGTAYWCDKRGCIRGVNMAGEQVFIYDMQTAVEATPMIYNETVYIGRIDGLMTAISLADKDTVWTYETMGQISASPNSVNFENKRAIVFGSYDNFLYCVDAQTGVEINRFESGYYINGAVALWKKHVLFGGCDSWLRVINCETGIATDSLELNAYVPASPAIEGNCCYVGDYSGNIYELLLDEGKIVNHKKIMEADNDNGSFVSVPAVTSDAIYFLSGSRYLYSVNRRTGVINWKQMLKGTVGESSPVVCRNKVIICTKNGIISILDAKSGKQEWEYDAGEQITGSPAVIKNHFMVLTAKGTLLCFGVKRN